MEMRGNMSYNKELVFTIKMMVHLYSYLYWGTRSRSCWVLVYLFLLTLFFKSWDDIGVIGKAFHVEYNAFDIVGIGSVFMEIFMY